jgi:hypothetical protein
MRNTAFLLLSAFTAISLFASGCTATQDATAGRAGFLDTPGYSLFKVTMKRDDTFQVSASVLGAPPEDPHATGAAPGYVLLASSEPPANVGWFALHGIPQGCPRAGDDAACNLDGEGNLVDVAVPVSDLTWSGPKSPGFAMAHEGTCTNNNGGEDNGNDVCVLYFAVMATPEITEFRPVRLTVTAHSDDRYSGVGTVEVEKLQ